MQWFEIALLVWVGTLWVSMMMVGFVHGVLARRLNKHLKLAHEERYRQLNSDKPWIPVLVDIMKLDRYAWLYLDDEDPLVASLKKRMRTTQVICLSLFCLIFITFLLYGYLMPE